MSKELSVGFQLYFYQLFSRELGIGKQTLIARVDEVLEQDNLNVADLEFDCSTTQELLEMMPTCIKLTIFKGGRVYATVLRVPEWDEALKKASKGNTKEGKSFKRKKSNALKPIRPRVRRQKPTKPNKEDLTPVDAPAEDTEVAPAQDASLETIIASALLEEIGLPDEQQTSEAADTLTAEEPAVAQEEQMEHVDDAPAELDAIAEEATQIEPEAPLAPEPPRPHLTITFDPSKDVEDPFTCASADCVDEDLSEDVLPKEPSDESEITCCSTVRDTDALALSQPVADDLPQTYPVNFTDEVNCNSQMLGLLSRIIPFGSNLAQILNEDWRYARATGSINGTQTRATFPLRYVHEDGITPVYLTIHRTRKLHQAAQWSLVLVDGKNANELDSQSVCFAGLPRTDVSSFEQLSPCACLDIPCSPERAFTTDCSVGSWDSFLSALAMLAAPERWSFDQQAQPYAILREYICATYLRLKQLDLIHISADKTSMAFNTGLFTLGNEAIYAWFVSNDSTTPWKFNAFKTASMSSEELEGSALHAAHYIDSIDQIYLKPGACLSVDTRGILTRSLMLIPLEFIKQEVADDEIALNHIAMLEDGNLTAPEREEICSNLAHYLVQSSKLFRRFNQYLTAGAQAAFMRAQSNYRSLATSFDPASGDVKLLLPLGFTSPHLTEAALVITLGASDGVTYTATSLMSIPCAYVTARTTSQDMPSWLTF